MVKLDFNSLREREFMVDLENGAYNEIDDEGSNNNNGNEANVISSVYYSNISLGEELSSTEKKKKKKSSKKPPKPPRPPRSPSMDAADQKLAMEISELAMLKRARVERMKALKKMKNAKGTSSKSNLFAFVITVVFCIVIIWQGLCPRGESKVRFQGSPVSSKKARSGFISVQFYKNRSKDQDANSASPNNVELTTGRDGQGEASRD